MNAARLARLTPEQRAGVLGEGKAEIFDEGKLTQGMIRTPLSRIRARVTALNARMAARMEQDALLAPNKGPRPAGDVIDGAMGSAYEDALAGGLHSGFLRRHRELPMVDVTGKLWALCYSLLERGVLNRRLFS